MKNQNQEKNTTTTKSPQSHDIFLWSEDTGCGEIDGFTMALIMSTLPCKQAGYRHWFHLGRQMMPVVSVGIHAA